MSSGYDESYWENRLARALASHLGSNYHAAQLLPPHGSMRRYARVWESPETSSVIMLLPPEDSGPAELGSARSERASDEPFIAVAEWLSKGGVRVPQIQHIDNGARAIWLEDLGDTNLDEALTSGRLEQHEAYGRALSLLGDFQQAAATIAPPATVRARALDTQVLSDELEHYVDWRTQRSLGIRLHPEQREVLDRAFAWLVEALTTAPTTLVHRDFQSRNIMVLADGALALIDFQDALAGPLPYDAVALLRDSYVELPTDTFVRMLAKWATATHAARGDSEPSADRLVHYFHLQTIQRKLKDTGRFELFRLAQQKASFASYIPTNLRYVRQALDALHDVAPLRELASVLAEIEPEFVA